MKIVIDKATIFGTEVFDFKSPICTICREDFNTPNKGTQSKSPIISKSIIVKGSCGHYFHQRCLNQWFNELDNTKKCCPTCNQQWICVRTIE